MYNLQHLARPQFGDASALTKKKKHYLVKCKEHINIKDEELNGDNEPLLYFCAI